MKNAFIIVLVTLAVIASLTFLFEKFINEASNTLFTIVGLLLILVIIFLYATFIIKQFKNRLK